MPSNITDWVRTEEGMDETAAACPLLIALQMKRRQRRRPNRRLWTREWILQRERLGAFHQLMQQICLSDSSSSYKNFVQMDATALSFEELLCAMRDMIECNVDCDAESRLSVSFSVRSFSHASSFCHFDCFCSSSFKLVLFGRNA